MRRVLTTLSSALGSLMKTRYVVLVLDVAGVHIHKSIHSLAKKLKTRLIFVPAKLTYLLQPCDTDLFRRFKHGLQESFRQVRSNSESGSLTAEQWRNLIFRASREIIQGVAWQHAFSSVGILDEQRQLAPWVLRQMEVSSLPALGCEPPSCDEAATIFPKRRHINVMAYVLWPEAPLVQAKAEPANLAHAPATTAGAAPSSASTGPPTRPALSTPTAGKLKWVLRPRKGKRLSDLRKSSLRAFVFNSDCTVDLCFPGQHLPQRRETPANEKVFALRPGLPCMNTSLATCI